MPKLNDITEAAKKKDTIVNLIYQKIDSLLGGGPTGQFFCMEFPARPLNYHMYEYDTSSRTSVVSKPFTVADSEFRLVDDLFNLAPIVQGSNGKKLSVTFLQLINNYVPKLKELHDFITDKVNIRSWLLATVEDVIDSVPFKGSRMELCKRLYGIYLKEKNRWDAEKTGEYDKRKTNDDLDGFADWLSRTGLVRDQELNNLFNDAVVRGYYHEVLTFLGFLNVCSSAEALETTKQNGRNSSRRSLDESMDVYPVQLQPNDWFKAMMPNLSPKDLTMAKDIVIAQYRSKQKEVAQLQTYLVQLESSTVSKADVDKATAAVEAGEAKFQEAESNLIKSYGDGAVGLVKIYLNAQTGGMASALNAKALDRTSPAGKSLGLDQIAQSVADGIFAGYKANQAYLQSAERLAQLRARAADAATHEYQAEITRVKARIDNIQSDLRYLASLASGVLLPDNQPNKADKLTKDGKPVLDADGKPVKSDTEEEPLPVLPVGGDDSVAGNMFMDVVINSTDDYSASNAESQSQASSSSWGVSFWIGSAGSKSSSQSASSKVEDAALSKEFTIGFRVAKVAIDRGGWFNPSVFEMSGCFQRIADRVQASPNNSIDQRLDKESVMKAISDPANAQSQLSALLKNKNGDPYMLPSFPVGFVIAKDITIRVQDNSSESELNKSLSEQSSSSGGGFLCFSASHASSSKSTAESSYHGMQSQYTYIRIPGPQIIGWFLQITPNDNSTKYEPLDKETLDQMRAGITDALKNPDTSTPSPTTPTAPVQPPAQPAGQ